jgi:uncharacterized protein
MSTLADLPMLGAGLGYRPVWEPHVRDRAVAGDWVEYIIEHGPGVPDAVRARLADLTRVVPVVPHGVEPSIGLWSDPDEAHIQASAALVAEWTAPWFSGHLDAADGAHDRPATWRGPARALGRKARRVQDAIGVPFLLENLGYADTAVARFVTEVLEHCECGLLLNLGLLVRAADEHAFDAAEFVACLPAERVIEVHLSAGVARPGTAVHFHGEPVAKAAWDLLDQVAEQAPIRATLVERDPGSGDAVAQMSTDVARARRLWTGR